MVCCRKVTNVRRWLRWWNMRAPIVVAMMVMMVFMVIAIVIVVMAIASQVAPWYSWQC